jgi:hypothetical protein
MKEVTMSKQSSIEWLEMELKKLPSIDILKTFAQAKQMHKEEIVNAYARGYEYYPLYEIEKQENNNAIRVTSKQYYQETYGGSPKTSDNCPK